MPDSETARVGYEPAKPPHSTQKLLACGLVVLLIVAIVILSVLLAEERARAGKSRASEVRRTELYVNEAGRMLRAMNASVDPCEDFWQYACGSYINENANLLPAQAKLGIFSTLNDELMHTLHELISVPVSSHDIASVQKVKTAYQACVDEETIENLGSSPLRTKLADLGTWPLLNPGWRSSSFDLPRTMAALAVQGAQVFAKPDVFYDLRNASFNTLYLSQPTVPFRDYLLSNSSDAQQIATAYHTLAAALAKKLMNDPREHARIDHELRDMFDFEKRLANITQSKAAEHNFSKSYNPQIVSDLNRNYPQRWDWEDYLPYLMDLAGAHLHTGSRIILSSRDYFLQLHDLLRHTDERVLVNYMLWHLVYGSYELLSSEYRKLAEPLTKLTSGVTEEDPRWKTCVHVVNSLFGSVVGRMYSVVHFPAQAKDDAMSMIRDLKIAFQNLITDADWMDEGTRSRALEKLRLMRDAIGYPDYIMDDAALNQEYAGVVVDNKAFFRNIMEAKKYSNMKSLQTYSLPIDDTRWRVSPATINAVYIVTENRIMFPAAILQKHFYNNEYPRFLNYGGIGAVIGHEITHGFDSKGRLFDAMGDLREWWTPATARNFEDRTGCLRDHYNNFTYRDLGRNVNGQLTLGENIADIGGVKEAFKAYRAWVTSHGGEEPKLPGFDHMTNDQMFFLAWGQIWCDVIRPSQLMTNLAYDVHAPNRFRVIGTVQNSEEFAKAYDCPKRSPMNPEKKCHVW